ncbi:hypothetical protein M422DRAFT_36407 [Sphaerobolus stellatus SS14]|uniref:Uncharacterized protein n=1 Tax=Sphaerobolus stellatus (strain SS14) TaxID=990650 RepID=A0A0C9TLT6_SPHS4|nr:hypothetical protein M422DRAFT_36407 [Sphaerobolus stellatus SS14]
MSLDLLQHPVTVPLLQAMHTTLLDYLASYVDIELLGGGAGIRSDQSSLRVSASGL